jgi:hypothetical protein
MRIKRENPEKLVSEHFSDDNAPSWIDRQKNQMGYAATSNCAAQVHGKHPNRGVQDARQVLSDLGVKGYTENDQAEAVQDRLEPEENEPSES